mgnify:CR=1 FL=1
MEKAKIKLKKTLYIGLGGTGVSALLKVKKCFIDSYGEIPPMIGFLAIDTDTAAFSKEETSNSGSTIRLNPSELLVCTVKNALPTYRSNPAAYDWVPPKNVNNLRNIAGLGAGQVRSNGRFIAYYNFNTIQTNISSAITKIHQLIPNTSKYTIDTNKDGVEYATTINVFASVAGGTGSGMLIDTLCLVNKSMKELALPYNLYPWIVLPEIFKSMSSGPAMANVRYNAYGAIRSLDYIEHLDPNDPAINFGYTTISEPLFDYAFVINNLNQAGVAFDKIGDLIDVVAKSAFLPANKMGDEISSPFDNIRHHQNGGSFNILDKKAWAASTGSAELIYDNQAVGRAYAYRVAALLCDSMSNSHTDGTEEANRFVDSQNVLIRENDGRNDVIDALISPAPEYVLTIDLDTTTNDINAYIEYNSGTRIDEELKSSLSRKTENTNREFEMFLSNLMDTTNSGCVGAALQFIRSLKTLIGLCRNEMEREQEAFNEQNGIPKQWEADLKSIRRTGIGAVFGSKTDEDNVEMLTQKLTNHVTNLREEKRRLWAVRFYNDFEMTVSGFERQLQNLHSHLNGIHDKYSDELLRQQQLASSTSKFQLFLHQSDVYKVSQYGMDDSIKADFHTYFSNAGGLLQWLSLSKEQVDAQIWNFAKRTSPVQKATGVSIDDVLKAMEPDTVKNYLEQLKVLASPLWSYNTQGYNQTQLSLDKFVIVGVGNRDTSIIKTSPEYNTVFDTNGSHASFASTYQNDRIYVLVVEDLLPIYAVNNYSAYKSDYEQKQAQNYPMAAYLDEKLNNRIISENFDVMPTIEQDNILQLWVWGFVFGYIHFDPETNYYWIRSKNRGDAIHKYRFNLNKQRDVAFDIFKTEGLYHEIEELLNTEISRHGNEAINQKIQQIKDDESYLEQYANLSPLEQSNLEDPKFKAVLNLVNQEIAIMTN